MTQLRAVRLFDGTGAFVGALGRSGSGPGEFVQPARAFEDPDGHVVVWDSRSRRFTRFARDGRAMEGAPPAPRSSLMLKAGAFDPTGALVALWEDLLPQVASPTTAPYRTTARWLRLGGGAADTLATFPGSGGEFRVVQDPGGGQGMEVVGARWYEPRLLAAATPEGIWTSDGTSWQLEYRTVRTGPLDRIVRLDRSLAPLTSELVEGVRAAMGGPPPSPQSVLPEHVPPMRELFADAVGRPWIGLLDPWSAAPFRDGERGRGVARPEPLG